MKNIYEKKKILDDLDTKKNYSREFNKNIFIK